MKDLSGDMRSLVNGGTMMATTANGNYFLPGPQPPLQAPLTVFSPFPNNPGPSNALAGPPGAPPIAVATQSAEHAIRTSSPKLSSSGKAISNGYPPSSFNPMMSVSSHNIPTATSLYDLSNSMAATSKPVYQHRFTPIQKVQMWNQDGYSLLAQNNGKHSMPHSSV